VKTKGLSQADQMGLQKKRDWRKQLRDDAFFLSHPALEGRDAHTPGIEVAAKYIAYRFRQSGLQGVGKEKSFFQEFPATTGVVVGTQNRLVTYADDKASEGKAWELQKDFNPFGFSATGRLRKLPVVFVGYGINDAKKGFDEYAGVDIRGKAVVMLRSLPRWADTPHSPFGVQKDLYARFRYKLLMAREKGAKAVLIVDPPDAKEKKEPALLPTSLARGLADAGIITAHIRREVAASLFKGGMAELIAYTQEIERTRKPVSRPLAGKLSLRVDLKRRQSTLRNVLGFVEGTDAAKKGEVIVLGAHYDHIGFGHVGGFPKHRGEIHPGADDNASGTAVLIALAQYFAAHPQPRSLLFIAFSGEERGLLGSAYYVRHPTHPLSSIVTMINLDMVGRLREKQLIAQGSGTSPIFEGLLKKIQQQHDLRIRFGRSGYGASDQTSFFTRKIPVLFFFTGAHRQYHSPADTFETLNLQGMAAIKRFVRDTTRAIAHEAKRPPFRDTPTPKRYRQRGRMRVSLGTIPDYGARLKEGVLLSGVRKGSSSEKAGVRGGDILLRIGRFELKNLYDMVIALSFYKPGDSVTLTVKRGEQLLNLPLVFEAPTSSHR
jgi:hypothetical protein